MFLFGILHQRGIFYPLDSQFFSDGGNLSQPSFSVPFAYGGGQLRDRQPKFTGIDRLDEVRLRAGAQRFLHITRSGHGRIEQYRSVRVELPNEATQSDPGPIRQPVVKDVKVEVPSPGYAQPLVEVAGVDELIFREIERHYLPRVFVVFHQKDVFSISVSIQHICASGEIESDAGIPLIVSALLLAPAYLRSIRV